MKKLSYLILAVFFVGLLYVDKAEAMNATSEFHGQFRINSYFQDSSKETTTIGSNIGEEDNTLASRLRWRPTWDVTVDDTVKMHLQLNIGHINSNASNARYTLDGGSNTGSATDTGDPVVALRHGYVSSPIPGFEQVSLTAGIVPVSDKFGDTLFSSDWDYNPLAFVLSGDFDGVMVRLAHANVDENNEATQTTTSADDVDHWILDVDTEFGLGGSYYGLNVNNTNSRLGSSTSANQHYFGVRYKGNFDPVDFNVWGVYNWGTRKFSAGLAERNNAGFAVKGEAGMALGKANVGVMAVYASGDKDFTDTTVDDSDAFVTPMSIVGHTGYWGYTGKLNVQGPTDTGIDCQAVNIDGADYCSGYGLGTGITSVQAKVSFPIISDRLDGYAAAGWFQSNSVPTGVEKQIGTDLYAQLKYHFSEHMALEAGVDYVALGDGHPDNGGLTTVSREITLVFSRLQLEY